MSEKHTQGPLVLGQHGAIRGGPMVSYINGSAQAQVAMTTGADWMVQGEYLANARRLVACWNACQGVPTEVLEGGLVADQLWGHLTAQRGTLLAALRCAIKKAPELITVPSIRSAIENAEGGR